jgi:hypothetical protein
MSTRLCNDHPTIAMSDEYRGTGFIKNDFGRCDVVFEGGLWDLHDMNGIAVMLKNFRHLLPARPVSKRSVHKHD